MTTPCAATSDTTLGGLCALQTTMDAVRPGLAAEGTTEIDGWEAVATSYPGFEADLRSLLA